MRYLWFILFPLAILAQPPTGRIAILTNSFPMGNGFGIDFVRGVTGYAAGPYFRLGSTVQSLTNDLIQTNGANLGSPNTINYTRGLTGFVSGVVGNIGVSLADTNLLVQTNGVNIDSSGTINYNRGITGHVASGVNILGVSLADTNQLIQTNGVTLGSAGTVNWNNGVTGFLSGAVATLGVSSSGGGGGTNFDQIIVTNGVLLGADASVGIFYGWDAANAQYHRALQMDDFVLIWGTNDISHRFLGTSVDFDAPIVRPSTDNQSSLGLDSIRWAAVRSVTNWTIQSKYYIWTNYVQTVSNFVFSFNTNRYELKNQTNVVFTNLVEEATATGSDIEVHIHNTTAVTMGLVWPAYGAQHGYYFQTNVLSPILSRTTLAAGEHGRATFKAFGSNIFASFEVWP